MLEKRQMFDHDLVAVSDVTILSSFATIELAFSGCVV